jgi:hypothetical protein
MKSILLLALIALTTSQIDLQSEPIPVIKCLISSPVLQKDVPILIEAVKTFMEDKNVLVFVSKILALYPEIEKEVKRCFAEEGIVLESSMDIPEAIRKLWEKLPKGLRDELVKWVKTLAKQKAKELCIKLLTKQGWETKICDYIDSF